MAWPQLMVWDCHGVYILYVAAMIDEDAITRPFEAVRGQLEERVWKLKLQKFADETGLAITVCHDPPGTSKWNKIEHRPHRRLRARYQHLSKGP